MLAIALVVGVGAGATTAEARAAYLRRVKETHPDQNPDKDGSEFKAVQKAAEKLGVA